MKKAGCDSVFFGLESGSDEILKIMNKQTDKGKAVEAVKTAKKAGIKVGAFFIIGYPGETDRTLIETINFASSLGLDYLSFNFPYPIPGTGLYEKVKDDLLVDDPLSSGKDLTFRSKISTRKLKFAEFKGLTQHKIGNYTYLIKLFLYHPFRVLTDSILKLMD
jgi:anaerobic magnesium-protoporphyrin IX monomethyl ester cyclase